MSREYSPAIRIEPAHIFVRERGQPHPGPTVGHRALVAAERADGRYDLYYSQWGAAGWQLAAILATSRSGDPTTGRGAVGPAPLATGCTFEALLAEHLDFQAYEALFLVARSGTVRPHLVCWFGLPGVDRVRPGDGGLIAVDADSPVADGEYLRGWFAGTKETVLDATDRGAFTPAEARAYLAARVGDWRDVRTVYFGPDATRSE